MYLPNLKSVPFSVPEIIGGTRKTKQSLDTPTLSYLKFFTGLCSVGPCECYRPNLKSVALPVREIIAIVVWVGVQTPILGKGRPYGVRGGTIRKSRSVPIFL